MHVDGNEYATTAPAAVPVLAMVARVDELYRTLLAAKDAELVSKEAVLAGKDPDDIRFGQHHDGFRLTELDPKLPFDLLDQCEVREGVPCSDRLGIDHCGQLIGGNGGGHVLLHAEQTKLDFVGSGLLGVQLEAVALEVLHGVDPAVGADVDGGNIAARGIRERRVLIACEHAARCRVEPQFQGFRGGGLLQRCADAQGVFGFPLAAELPRLRSDHDR